MRNLTFTLPLIILIFLSSCQKINFENGVSIKLANERKVNISNIQYNLHFIIPDSINEINAEETITFSLNNKNTPLVLDFKEDSEKIKAVYKNDKEIKYITSNEHIIIPKKYLSKGENSFTIKFIAGETSLNRNKEFLYTLFVPDRARTCFPCFDQPNMKAKFECTIDVPEEWTAIANGKLSNKTKAGNLTRYQFEETKPLPTYLFSFVAGKFEVISKTRDTRTINLFHRENDSLKLKNNVQDVFNQVFDAIEYMEEYSKIPYPFAKYDLIAIPFFQYGGMEHTGATLYRASKLLLSEKPTQKELVDRANLIAHETAHMWFGDYVTMHWFDEVWLKEVFANFIADKIIRPQFPEMNHELQFLMAHYPKSYAIDRTAGANPINQQLNNMNNAGTVYGAIIYHKAPIVMRQLELLTGEKALQKGLQQYLKNFAYSNATWNDLINILDSNTESNLKEWSDVWVFEPGMPHYISDISDSKLTLKQIDPSGENKLWVQPTTINSFGMNKGNTESVILNKNIIETEIKRKEALLINSKGISYGYFELDSISRDYFLKNTHKIKNELYRGAIWVNLWENFLNGKIDKKELLSSLLKGINSETNGLLLNLQINYLQKTFWVFHSDDERKVQAPKIEEAIWNLLNNPKTGLQKDYYKCYTKIAYTQVATNKLYNIWKGKSTPQGLSLNESDLIKLSYQIALRKPLESERILLTQLENTKNNDQQEKIKFVSPALSADQTIRSEFFNSLLKAKNREHEQWVITALQYLHHPLRQKESIQHLEASLEVLKEIQQTGDIFFPKQWLDAIFGNYSSTEAVKITNKFLDQHPDYPEKLKLKILQSTDMTNRAVKIANK